MGNAKLKDVIFSTNEYCHLGEGLYLGAGAIIEVEITDNDFVVTKSEFPNLLGKFKKELYSLDINDAGNFVLRENASTLEHLVSDANKKQQTSRITDEIWQKHFKNSKVAITGKCLIFVNRQDLCKALSINGSAAASGAFDTLIICGDHNNSAKYRKAKRNNIKIFSEKEVFEYAETQNWV